MTALLRPSLPLLLPGLLLVCPAVSSRAQSPASPAEREALKTELVKTEADFCAMARDQGIPAAFAHFIAPDGVLFDADPQQYRGAAAVARRYGDSRPSGILTWAPSFVDVAASGDLGYTWGRYEYRATGPDGQPHIATGYFLTIWKRQADGTWRFVIDNGAADRPKPPSAKPEASKPPAQPDEKHQP
jgi:ketosteroid isomerase-like protein